MIDCAVILAGGFGTRLKSVLPDVPKPLAPVHGRPFLHYIIDYLRRQQIRRVILSVGYRADQIHSAIGDTYLDIEINYSLESEPLGTGGALQAVFRNFPSLKDVFTLNGDTYFPISLKELWDFHMMQSSLLTIALRNTQCADRYGTVVLGQHGTITTFQEKQPNSAGLINGGIYALNSRIFTQERIRPFSLESELFPLMIKRKQAIAGKIFQAPFLDIGIPEDYDKASDLLKP